VPGHPDLYTNLHTRIHRAGKSAIIAIVRGRTARMSVV
jgi:hypothetical protein